jgi:alkanesulfonate monooxygenase SsuD/methylene tetrahydromethanopterin reductase-like flavin-dependent oxidoreductase (luciferase family)
MSPPLRLAVRLAGAGHHPAAWREPEIDPRRLFGADHWIHLAQEAERGGLDLAIIDDSLGPPTHRSDRVRGRLDGLQIAARMAPVTRAIGLVPTVTTTHTEPFHLAKNLATLDWVSKGRAGWHVAVSSTEAEARQFGRKPAAPLDDLIHEADEAIEVVHRLCDSWEDDAIIRDVPTGRFLDRDKVHYIGFEGTNFSVRGPSITPRSPQGQPLIAVTVGPEPTAAAIALAARRADLVFIAATDIAAAGSLAAAVREQQHIEGRDPGAVTIFATASILVGFNDAAANAHWRTLESWDHAEPAPVIELVGGPRRIADAFEAWSRVGAVDGVVIAPLTLPAGLTAFVDLVLPLLRERGLRPTAPAAPTEPNGGTLRDRFGLARPRSRYATATET